MKIIVIGGGVIGLSCAWRLAMAGAKVEVLEARHAGAGGEGASTAALGALWPCHPLADGPLAQLHRESLWQFESFVSELERRAGLQVPFARLGRVECFATADARERAELQAARAVAEWPAFAAPQPVMQVVSADELAALVPGIGESVHQGGLYCRATAQVHSRELLAALKAACLRDGVRIHEQYAAHSFELEGGRITAVFVHSTRESPAAVRARDPGEEHTADAYLVAAGAWTALLGQGPPIDLAGVAPVRPVKGQGIALQIPPGLTLNTIVKSGPIYLVPWPDEILVGSTTEPEAEFNEAPTGEGREILAAGAAAIIPQLAGAPILRHWAGLRPQIAPKPHLPVMGVHPRFSSLFICTGHYKTGIGLAPRVSSLMAEAILSRQCPPALAPFAPRIDP